MRLKSFAEEGETVIAKKSVVPKKTRNSLEKIILTSLDNHKAEDIVSIDLTGKADFADRMVIASGTSQRHIGALASHVVEALKKAGLTHVMVEGEGEGDWVLVDAGDIIIHLFKPETRHYYNLEKMWSVSMPQLEAAY